ncbi:MAG: pyruvate dehydrogenase (acetyl-transferring) E1 component subunit alpha, partial [Cyanobacteria bacterium J06636_27]
MIQERTLPNFNANTTQINKEEGLRIYEDMVLGRFFE